MQAKKKQKKDNGGVTTDELSDKRLTRRSANQTAENVMQAKQKQKKGNGGDHKKNVSYFALLIIHIVFLKSNFKF